MERKVPSSEKTRVDLTVVKAQFRCQNICKTFVNEVFCSSWYKDLFFFARNWIISTKLGNDGKILGMAVSKDPKKQSKLWWHVASLVD